MPELTTRAFRTFSQQNLTMSLLTGLLLSFGSVAVRGGTATDSLVDAAWKAWQVPDYVLAEKNFRSAIAVESSNTRACVGLALLLSLIHI